MRFQPRKTIHKVISTRWCRGLWYCVVVGFFLCFVLTPTVYVLSYAYSGWGDINVYVLKTPEVSNLILNSLLISFALAAVVTVVDFIAGLPMAWILARYSFRGKRLLDTLIDMPLVIPTSALGFSAALFWARPEGLASLFSLNTGILSYFFPLIMMVHFAFSYPYMVRSLAAILEEIDVTYETAGRTLGASPLTAARTITLPLFKSGLLTGVILSFSRSISETGATIIALSIIGTAIPGSENTAPVLIGAWRSMIEENPQLLPASAFTSIILIASASVIWLTATVLLTKFKIPAKKVWPSAERFLSRSWPRPTRDFCAHLFLVFAVLIPSFFIIAYALRGPSAVEGEVVDWMRFWNSLSASFSIATTVTLINLFLGVPMAILIARSPIQLASRTLDILVNVPIIIPTAALGFSLGIFWREQTWFPLRGDFWLITLAHLAFTYPFIVRTVTGAIREIDRTYEDAARTLGAKPIQVFRRITLPIAKPSLLAGAIMMFTRSLDETGATIAVVPTAVTAPVYIVDLVKKTAYYQAALTCIALIAVAYAAMLAIRYVTARAK